MPPLSPKAFLGEVNGFSFFKTENGYRITYGVEPSRAVGVDLDDSFSRADAYYQVPKVPLARCDIADLLYHGYRYRAMLCGDMMIHAAAVVYGGEGILFCGLHAAGKSTQANLWIRHLNAEPLNFDQPCLIPQEDGVLVHGSPWSGKEELFLNQSAPVRAIVFVKKASENRAVRLSKAEAYSELYLNNYLFPLTENVETQYQQVIENVVRQVPVYRLFCTKDVQAVEALYGEIYGTPCPTKKRRESMRYKRKDCFLMKDVAGDKVVIARGQVAIAFNGMMVLNDSCVLLWEALEDYKTAEELADVLVQAYGIDVQTARNDTQICLQKMLETELLDTAE